MAIWNTDKENLNEMIRDAARMATTRVGAPTAEQADLMKSALTSASGVWGSKQPSQQGAYRTHAELFPKTTPMAGKGVGGVAPSGKDETEIPPTIEQPPPFQAASDSIAEKIRKRSEVMKNGISTGGL